MLAFAVELITMSLFMVLSMILAEVFLNHILAENTFFTNHRV